MVERSVRESPSVVSTGSRKNRRMRMVAGSRNSAGTMYRSTGRAWTLCSLIPVFCLLDDDLIANRTLHLGGHQIHCLLRGDLARLHSRDPAEDGVLPLREVRMRRCERCVVEEVADLLQESVVDDARRGAQHRQV